MDGWIDITLVVLLKIDDPVIQSFVRFLCYAVSGFLSGNHGIRVTLLRVLYVGVFSLALWRSTL